MYEFEKRIIEMERLHPAVSYPFKVIPITEKAKFKFAKYFDGTGRIIRKSEMEAFIEKNLDVNREPFIGEITLYYDDPNKNIKFIQNCVVRSLAVRGVHGISFNDGKGYQISYLDNIKLGKDFNIEIGEKNIHEKPKQLTFNDIKAL